MGQLYLLVFFVHLFILRTGLSETIEISSDTCQSAGNAEPSCVNEGSNLPNFQEWDDKEWTDMLYFPDGGVYSGGVVNDVQQGVGREETAAGDRYEGEWEGGMKSGAGKYKWKDGRSYKGIVQIIAIWLKLKLHFLFAHCEGEFRDNVPNGIGMLKAADGGSYIGMWVDGSKQGMGRYRWAGGKVYEGEWDRGVQHGQGKLYAPPSGSNGEGHRGTNGNVGEILYEGLFHDGT